MQQRHQAGADLPLPERVARLRRLWGAVVWQALRDLTPGETRCDISADPRTQRARQQMRQLRQDATRWLYAAQPAVRDEAPLPTFAEIADWLGVDAAGVRHALRHGLVIGPWPLATTRTDRVAQGKGQRAVQTYPEEERAVGVAGR